MTSTHINSGELLDIGAVRTFANNIHLNFNSELKQYYENKFPGYYIFKVPATIVEEVYFQGFFLSQEYFDAIEKKAFSKKWEVYIRSKKNGEFYILDAHDYNGHIWSYFSNSQENINIEFYGEKFWIYHDLGHVYLNHLYTHGTFMHRDEMDASIFAAIKLILEGGFEEKKIKNLVVLAAKDCLKSGKIINHEDIKYLFTYMDSFHKILQS